MKGSGYIIYGLTDPRDGLVHYLGRTMEGSTRLRSHRYRSPYGKARLAWLASLQAAGLEYGVQVLARSHSFSGICRLEREWIEKARRGQWPLTNRQPGGTSGGKPAHVQRQRKARALKKRAELNDLVAASEARLRAAYSSFWEEHHPKK